MKTCKKCGALCPESALYCESCGSFFDEMDIEEQKTGGSTETENEKSAESETASTNEMNTESTEQENAQQTPDTEEQKTDSEKLQPEEKNADSGTEAQNATETKQYQNFSKVTRPSDIVRRNGSSLMFFIAVILLCSSVIFGVLDAVIPKKTVEIDIAEVMIDIRTMLVQNVENLDGEITEAIDEFIEAYYGMKFEVGERTLWSATVGKVFTLLIIGGLLWFYIACRKKESGNIATGGLTMIRVVAIIEFVFTCLPVLLFAFIGAIVLITLFAAGQTFGAIVILIVFAIVAAVCALFIAYRWKMIKSIESAEKAAQNVTSFGTFSKFFAIMFCVLTAFAMTSALSSLPFGASAWSTFAVNVRVNLGDIQIPQGINTLLEQISSLPRSACSVLEEISYAVGMFVLSLSLLQYEKEINAYTLRPASFN